MALAKKWVSIVYIALALSLLSSCFKPPYNDFKEDRRNAKYMIATTAVGASVGAVAGVAVGNAGTGAILGGILGGVIGYQNITRQNLIMELESQDIQYIHYGDTISLVVPTDRYFIFNTPQLNDICYPGLVNIIRLLRHYKECPIYVAGFTDNIGTKHHKKMLSQSRAETMLTFLWAHGISAQRLHAEGYQDKHAIGDNKLIRGSAYNRRIEIQWPTCCKAPCEDVGWKK